MQLFMPMFMHISRILYPQRRNIIGVVIAVNLHRGSFLVKLLSRAGISHDLNFKHKKSTGQIFSFG